MNEIIGQILGIVATAITVLSYQANDKGRLLAIQTVATVSTCLGYFFLGAWSGFALNIVCVLRNVSFYFLREKVRLNRAATVIFSVAMVAVGLLSWQGWISLIMLVAFALNTLFMGFGSPQALRYSVCLTSSMILLYNIFVFTVGGIMNEGLAIVSSVIGIVRFRRGKSA